MLDMKKVTEYCRIIEVNNFDFDSLDAAQQLYDYLQELNQSGTSIGVMVDAYIRSFNAWIAPKIDVKRTASNLLGELRYLHAKLKDKNKD